MIIIETVPGDQALAIEKIYLSPLLSDQYLRERIDAIERSLNQKRIVWMIACSEDPKSHQTLKRDLLSLAARFDSLSEMTLPPVPYEGALAMILTPKISIIDELWAQGRQGLPPFPWVLLRDEQQRCLGLMSPEAAREIARKQGFDAAMKDSQWPPLCVFAAAGSQRYKAQRELRERNRPTHYSQRRVKGVRIRVRIGDADLERKAREIRRHLKKQHCARVRIQSFGRGRKDSAGRMRLFLRLVELVGDAAKSGPVTEERVASLMGVFTPSS